MKKNDSGAVMLEATIVVTITLLMLVWILGIGFIYYQKYVVRIVTNDAAKKIAATYDNPSSDLFIGYVNAKDFRSAALYATPDLTDVNEQRAESYVKYILDKANFSGVVDEVTVHLQPISDALGRSHITLTTNCTFNTPFGAGLEMFGMSGKRTYEVTSYAESTSISDYVTCVNFRAALTGGTFLSGMGFIDDVVKMVNSIIKMCNQLGS